jgi:cytoskeletal protein CcmA (bactofilin family)
MRHAWVIFGVLAVGLIFAAPASAQTAEQDQGKSLVVLSGDTLVPRGADIDTVVAFDGAVVVDGHVAGTVVAFSGPVTINGTVVQDVVVFDGVLRLGPGARVGGSVYADDRVIDPRAQVSGTVSELASAAWVPPMFVIGFAVWLAIAVSVLVLGLLLLWLVPRAMEAAAGVARTAVGPAIGWGLAIMIGLPVLSVAAMATLVGFPLGFGVLLALALIFAIGQTAGVWVLGRILLRRGSHTKAFLLGWAIVSAIALVPFVGGVVWGAVTIYGLGALLVAGYRVRRAPIAPTVVPAPPVPLST